MRFLTPFGMTMITREEKAFSVLRPKMLFSSHPSLSFRAKRSEVRNPSHQMRKLFILFFFTLCLSFGSLQAQILKSVTNTAFKKGEVLVYRVHYGFLDAGEARLEVKDEEKKFGPRDAFHIVGTGESKGTFNWFFKVRDRYETFIDADAMVPWVFIRRVEEGSYKLNQNFVFNPYKKTVDNDGNIFNVPENVQDMISAFYYLRCIDFSNANIGDSITIMGFVDNEVVPLRIRYVGKETIQTDLGTFKCNIFRPVVITGRIFKSEEDVNVWVTDDKNHIPIRAQAKILVGSVKMDIKSYSGLANPISKVE